jgi:hypothetical protein
MASLHSSLGIRGSIIISSFRVDINGGVMLNLSETKNKHNHMQDDTGIADISFD